MLICRAVARHGKRGCHRGCPSSVANLELSENRPTPKMCSQGGGGQPPLVRLSLILSQSHEPNKSTINRINGRPYPHFPYALMTPSVCAF